MVVRKHSPETSTTLLCRLAGVILYPQALYVPIWAKVVCYSEQELERSLLDALSASCARTAAVSAQRVNAHNAADEHGIDAVNACRREHETVLRKVYDEDFRLWEEHCARTVEGG